MKRGLSFLGEARWPEIIRLTVFSRARLQSLRGMMTVASRTRSVFDAMRVSVLGFCGNSVHQTVMVQNNAAPERKLGRRARSLAGACAVENEISRALCLGGGVNQELSIVAKLLEPAGHVGGLILDDGG